MRVASYNIRKAVGLDWRRDGDRVVSVLEEINADVVVLQESDKRVGQRAGVLPLKRLQENLGYELADVSERALSHGWHGNAILYRREVIQLDRAIRVELPTLEPRGAVSAHLSAPSIEVIGVHLGLTRRTRAKQLAALKRHMDAVQCPVLVAGDFNAWHPEAGIITALGDDYEMVLPGNSFHASRPIAALDRFILKGGVGHVSSHVHRSALAARASDHLPIVIDLDVPR
ncbi:endonuclease/exonuclease/phosphatase family protein [Litoreibacter arenae]|uniref:Endonuclease/exonuclease/phosphatase n=1 Tax=Litoreibacter arenae DSM 19593 TaxID=1123360 RepID=S9RZK4_9RHOB|nr:endonuclease/exonuclease/phosphatase family protein [Litoreibacter arenae]EPX79419.1 Endonuclease/exonuclease/phosphatase [Litoreibacter arenae DSM 19593]